MKLSRFLTKNSILNNIKLYSNVHSKISVSSVAKTLAKRKDFEELFLDNNVRYMLRQLTGYDPKIVFQSRSLKNLNSPKYRFMTEEQLQMEREAADKRAEKLLQMPPVKYPSTPQPKIFEKDPALVGFVTNKFIFVDATPGFSEQERLIVVRDVDGTLREATREERHRMNQTYYPQEERLMDVPKMLQPEYILPVLERGAYKLLLDNACLHYEPEDPEYQRVCHQVYDHIEDHGAFESLYSTRHYGGMVYYYAYFKNINKLFLHLFKINRLDDVYYLLKLHYIIHPDPDSPKELKNEDNLKFSLSELAQKSNHIRLPISVEKFIEILKFYVNTNIKDRESKAEFELIIQKVEAEYRKKEKKSARVNQ